MGKPGDLVERVAKVIEREDGYYPQMALAAITETLEAMRDEADTYGLAATQLRGLIDDFASAHNITLKKGIEKDNA